MKNSFKKLTAITLSSLGILASAPSAFCAPKACHSSKEKNHDITKAPKKRSGQTKSSKTEIISDRMLSKGSFKGKITQKTLKAPNATCIYDDTFSNQPNLEKIYLPEAYHVGSCAFENCKKLKTIVFTDKLKLLAFDAFLGCPDDLKIIYEGKKYSASDFMKVVKPYKVEIRQGSFQPFFTNYGPDKINIMVRPMREKVDDTTVAEDADTSETIVLSEIDR